MEDMQIKVKEALNNSTCADWRGNLAPIKAQKRRNPLWISSFCNAEWHKIHRQDVRGELFSVSYSSGSFAGMVL